jgi:hypothetical protein
MFCYKTNSDITTEFFTERLSPVQVLRYLRTSTRDHHWLVLCSRTWKWRICWREKGEVCVAVRTNHSATLVQLWFRTNYGKESPTRKLTYKWHKSFAETGFICTKKNILGRWPIDEIAERVRALLYRSPQKSTRRVVCVVLGPAWHNSYLLLSLRINTPFNYPITRSCPACLFPKGSVSF